MINRVLCKNKLKSGKLEEVYYQE